METSADGVTHFNNQDPVLISELLHDVLNINYEGFKGLLKLGAIYVNDTRQIKDRWIKEKSLFRVHTRPRRFNCEFDWRSLIVFENESLLILNKPSGLPSHPAVDNIIENALTQASLICKTPLLVTHRLDTLTSGLIVYGKKRSFVKEFNLQLMARSVEKKYVALTEGNPTFPTELTHFMDPAFGTPKKLSLNPKKDWAECKLEIIEQRKVSPSLTWVKINLLTGKTHQIRSQLAHLGAPILGDALYGSRQSFSANAIALRSCEMQFECDGKSMRFSLSEDFTIPV